MNAFNDRVAIITGGASGIGRALGEELAARGAIVVLADCDREHLNEAAAAIAARGGKVEAAPLDVTDAEAFGRLVADTASKQGRLDYLFNNAGVAVGGEAADLDAEAWNRVLEVNLFGVINGVRAAYPLMIAQGFGHIVNTASAAGLVPFPMQLPYTTSKFAVVGLSQALRTEAHDLGVRVSVVCPGLIETPILRTTPVVGMDSDVLFGLFPKGMAPAVCARTILRGVEKNRGIITVTGLARVLWFIYRLSPTLYVRIMVSVIRRLRALRDSQSAGVKMKE